MNETVVVKCGGSTIAELSEGFYKSIHVLKQSGKQPMIVHGGGPEINELLTTMNVQTEFVDGLRKTTEAVLEAAEMVLCGKVNKRLVRQLQTCGVHSIGLSGCDGQLIEAQPVNQERLGYVGEVVNVNSTFLQHMLSYDLTPVIAPVATSPSGTRYNINADSAAGAIAEAMHAKQLIFVTDVAGILKDGVLLEEVTVAEIEQLIEDGTIYGGMIPKVKAAIKSLQGNIESVMIIDGKESSLSHEGSIIGTKVVKTKPVVT